jgi:peroxiredoxin
VAHVLQQITVFDPDGREIRLGQLWAERTVVLVFVRHFGCLFCREQIAALRHLGGRVRSLGAELVLIGHGTVEQARAFRDEAGPLPVFTDPTRQAYCAMNMRRGRRSVMTVGVLRRALRAWRLGFRQSRVAGDPFQQGGVVIVDPTGLERYRFISREAGLHPRPADILAALEATLNSQLSRLKSH